MEKELLLVAALPKFCCSGYKMSGGMQTSEPSVACFHIHLCAVMQIYNDFGWELLFWQSVGCMLWCFPLTRQAACLKHKLVKILERADNDTVSVISVKRSYLFFKFLHSSLLRTLHRSCHSAAFKCCHFCRDSWLFLLSWTKQTSWLT